ncbi:MAG: hypothetical protein ACLFS9_11865, partial [Nitriliruptoraceae bacterium]
MSITDADGRLLAASGVQHALALDERFATDEPLGPRWHADGSVTVSVWAPTARRLTLRVTDEPSRGEHARWTCLPASRGPRGVWTTRIGADHLDEPSGSPTAGAEPSDRPGGESGGLA